MTATKQQWNKFLAACGIGRLRVGDKIRLPATGQVIGVWSERYRPIMQKWVDEGEWEKV